MVSAKILLSNKVAFTGSGLRTSVYLSGDTVHPVRRGKRMWRGMRRAARPGRSEAAERAEAGLYL